MRKRKMEPMKRTMILMRNILESAIGVFVLGYAVFITIFFFSYRQPDYKTLWFLSQWPTEERVVEFFGCAPEIVYQKGETLQALGWKLPEDVASSKILIYTNRSALRFYIYIDDGGKVTRVFTSNS